MGYEEGGQHTEAVRRRPYTVILFDEIEKAHPEVFNVLLQLLDDGRLTDSKGRTVDFKNTVIIMTSNLGSHVIAEFSDKPDEQDKAVRKLLAEHFRPEFLNRLDDIIIFQPLSQDEVAKIVTLQLNEVEQRLQNKNIKVEFEQNLIDHLAKVGFDPTFGARPLKRLIQNEILDELAMKIIEGEIGEGDSIKLNYNNNKLNIDK